MNKHLTSKHLAEIKRKAQTNRIGSIRRRVAMLGVTLAAVFSGVIFVRTEVDQPAAGSPAGSTATGTAPVTSNEIGVSDMGFDGEALGGAVVGVVTGILSDSSDEEGSTSPLETSQS